MLSTATVGEKGLYGDRGWAIRDETDGEIQGAKKHPLLMQCSAHYAQAPKAGEIPAASITLPDGTRTATDDESINEILSGLLGRPVSLWAQQPASDQEHYRRRVPLTEQALRAALGQRADEATADISWMPESLLAEITEFTSPRGTYFDAFPIHLLSTSWLATLAAEHPDSRFEVPRYRPNLVIESDQPGLPELDWCGKRLRIGQLELNCEIPTIRCIMTSHQTADLPKDIGVVRAAAQQTDRNVGAYASVAVGGEVRVGDEVSLL